VTTLLEKEKIQPMIGEVFALADAPTAFAHAMAGDTRGKVVLCIAQG